LRRAFQGYGFHAYADVGDLTTSTKRMWTAREPRQ
jgi:hypothetical protein